ncbi:MAG: hypothetical protein WBK24_08390, partial [Dethiobacteria bacterium]
DGKLDLSSDLVVWTKHFTEFVIYAPAQEPGEEPSEEPGEEPGEDEPPKEPLPRTWGGGMPPVMLFAAVLTLICSGLFISLNRRRETGM